VFFFQPLVWYAARQVSYLAEVACDSAALEHEGNPTVYAELLTRLAFRLPDRAPSTELAAGILFTNSAFFKRIRVILSDRRHELQILTKQAAAGLFLAGLAVLLAIASMPLGEKRAIPSTLIEEVIPDVSALQADGEIARTLGNYGGSTESRMAEKIRKATTPEKKAAIEKLLHFWRNYRSNDLSILMCSDMIIETDRNISVIERISKYSLETGSNTMIYIGIAKCAVKSIKASQEFLDLAAVVERQGGSISLVKIAQNLAKANNEKELKPLRKKIAKMK
jgi:hypothetical protein